MTPEEKVSLEKIFNFEQLEKIQEVLEKLKNDEDIKNCLTNRTLSGFESKNLPWYFEELVSGTARFYHDIKLQKRGLEIDADDLTYTNFVLRFFFLQKEVYQYQESLRHIRNIIDQNKLFQKTHNNPEKKWLVDAYAFIDDASQNLMKTTITKAFTDSASFDLLDSTALEAYVYDLRARLIILAPQNFADYVIDWFLVKHLYDGYFAMEPYKAVVAEKLAKDLKDLYYLRDQHNYLGDHRSHELSADSLRRSFGYYINEINTIVHKKMADSTIGSQVTVIYTLKEDVVNKVINFQLPAFAAGGIQPVKSGQFSYRFSKKNIPMTVYTHPCFIDGLPIEKQLTFNTKPHLVFTPKHNEFVQINIPANGYLFTVISDLGPNYVRDFRAVFKDHCSVVVCNEASGRESISPMYGHMTTYMYPVSRQDAYLYLNQLEGLDLINYIYCVYDPCASDLNYASPSNQIKPGTLLPLAQMTKGSSAFIAECNPTPTTHRGLEIKQIIHLFDMGMYK